MPFELRTADLWPDADYELRAAPDGFTFEGYAALYERESVRMSFPSVNRGQPFREVIEPGAFRKSLDSKPTVTLRYQHNMSALPLASTKSGTMSLADDGRGLRVQASLPDNEWGRPVRDAIARGDIGGMSFRFQSVIEDTKGTASDGLKLRRLMEVRLGPEVSVTEFPAYPDTVATVRALAEEADVDPEALISALSALKPESRLEPAQRDALIAVINTHSETPVIGIDAAQKQAQMRERLARLAG
jgi:HK97 family phage prohead protease